MLVLEHPWLLLLLALPLAIRRLLPSYARARRAVRTPFFTEMARLLDREPSRGAVVAQTPALHRAGLAIAWVLLVVAAARPQWIEDPVVETRAARDLLLAVDLSQSMETRDFVDARGDQIDRLTAVKRVLEGFIARRPDDRLGLLLFGSAAFVQAPPTEDHATLQALLDELEVGIAGPQTMMGEAIGLAIRLFEEREADQRVLVLLTDGNDTGSKVPPEEAARIAAERDVTIHAIGVGDPAAAGEQAFDEETLRAVAGATEGGRYFRASDPAELAQVYATIDGMLPREVESISWRPRRPLFWMPLGAMLLLALAYHGCRLARRAVA